MLISAVIATKNSNSHFGLQSPDNGPDYSAVPFPSTPSFIATLSLATNLTLEGQARDEKSEVPRRPASGPRLTLTVLGFYSNACDIYPLAFIIRGQPGHPQNKASLLLSVTVSEILL